MIVTVLVVLVPGASLLVPLLISGAPLPREQQLPLAMTLGACVLTAALMQFAYQRLAAYSMEATDMGIHHLAPGREKTLFWQDVIEAKIVPYAKNQTAVRIRSESTRYVFPPHIVPDTPDAPEWHFGFPRSYWLYPDGHREVADIPHCFGYKIVQQYRPDLLTGRLAPKNIS
jgi:hypothetical protein